LSRPNETPGNTIVQFLSTFAHGKEDQAILSFNYRLQLRYLEVPESVELAAMIQFNRKNNGAVKLLAAVSDQVESFNASLGQPNPDFETVCVDLGLPIIDLTAPMLLDTVSISKPWGREIWYTGCEARGVSCIQGVPLPWVVSLHAMGIMGRENETPLLLKILDPLPVYVITHVDESAWPGGIGRIRYGFDEQKQASYRDEKLFKSAYLGSVKQYRDIRNRIDNQLDIFRHEDGFELNAPVPTQTISAWLDKVPGEWLEKEQLLRSEMESFTGMRPLSVGDVISIPTHTPHALQHGVRAIEFQTPHYERQILSFAQKVLTQPGWDTEEALDLINVHAQSPVALEVLHADKGVVVESIARFEQFMALRITLESGSSYVFEMDAYALLISVRGQCKIANLELAPEQACLIPKMCIDPRITNPTEQAIQCLLAYPIGPP
jgi:hypothetical protein